MTPRAEILRLANEGRSTSEIALVLGLKPDTVRWTLRAAGYRRVERWERKP